LIALIGGEGSIGRRYAAILKYLKAPFEILDDPKLSAKDWNFKGYKKAIIATPTSTHYEFAKALDEHGVPFLCEKPLTTSLVEAEQFEHLKGYTVCNWNHAIAHMPGPIHYDFYNTGRDGLLWDVCQLVYLAYLKQCELKVKRSSPVWSAHAGAPIDYRDIE
jgi:hypothetical protein